MLGEREFRIGRFYFLRQSYPAAIARLKTLTDSYPLYSGADEALYMLGSAFEGQIEITRAAKVTNEVHKARLIEEFTSKAAEAYSQILTRYPVMTRSADAAKRLQALGRSVPTATPEAIAQNRAELESRGETGTMDRIMGNFKRGPNVSQAVKVGEPNLTGTKDSSAPEFLRRAQETMLGTSSDQASGTVSVETVRQGAPPANQPAPRSTPEESLPPAEVETVGDDQASQQPSESTIPELPLEPNDSQHAPPPPPQAEEPPAANPQSDQNEATPPPRQVNDAQPAVPQADGNGQSETAVQPAAENPPANAKSDEKNTSSSKKKKKKGLPQPPQN